MADELPALEIAAALGAVVAGIRTYQLMAARAQVPRLEKELEAALSQGDMARAGEVCREAQGAAFVSVAEALLDVLTTTRARAERAALTTELENTARSALAGVRARVQSARVRDLLVAFVLVAAAFYASHSAIAYSAILYPLAGLGALFAVLGFLLRPGLLALIESESARLVEVAAAAVVQGAGGADACSQCGGTEIILVDPARALHPSSGLVLSELGICRRCGHVQGAAENPGAIPIGAEHGTSLRRTMQTLSDDDPAEPPEHQG